MQNKFSRVNKEYILKQMKKRINIFIIIMFSMCTMMISCGRGYILPGNRSKKLPHFGNGRLISIKNDSRKVYGYFVRGNNRLIVFFHGQHSNIRTESQYAKIFYNAGFSILIIEYAGYGIAKKYSPSESVLYSDSEKMIKYVQKNYNYTIKNTTAWGRSLGSGVAAEMAVRKRIGKLILVTPFTSIAAVASDKYVPILPYLLVWDNFNTLGKADKILIPTIIIHGKKDKVVPHYMGEKLSKKIKNSKFISLKYGNHWSFLKYLTSKHWVAIFNLCRN